MNNINFIKYNNDYEYYNNKDESDNEDNKDEILEQVLEKIEEKYCNKNNKVFQKSKL